MNSNFPELGYAEVLSREQLKKIIAGTRVATVGACGDSCIGDGQCPDPKCQHCRNDNPQHLSVCQGPKKDE